jgi:hypothetical protein
MIVEKFTTIKRDGYFIQQLIFSYKGEIHGFAITSGAPYTQKAVEQLAIKQL